ncbi:NADPH:quinone reductase [Alienimonas californiensis]|uniref:Quinone oxidoreductase 1 n=1 Tax=Alienimonas californiensis TaxID=2527989 RepID=A0A517PFA5_9PLAN|nr:NADPH:quinone reductase [Alienimonas californiensis]QDT18052.1 Quinone oxidoreductase 1 [Alienimonas californiensis]
MRAAVFTAPGPPEVLLVRDLRDPGDPGEGEVRVKVGAVSVNPIDTYVRGGVVSPGPAPSEENPRIIGCDWAGTVEAVGSAVSRFAVGNRVWGVSRGIARDGAAAEVLNESEDLCFPTPEDRTDVQAAALGLAAVTAHLGLFRTGGLEERETGERFVFVQAGSGGVGSAAVALAAAAGYRVVTTAGSDAKRSACRERGAEVTFDYGDPDLADRLEAVLSHERMEEPRGFSVWLEGHRDPDLHAAIPLMRQGGAIVLFAGRSSEPCFPLGALYTRDISLRGFAMFNATAEELQTAAAGVARIEPLIARSYPLSEIARAHADQEAGDTGDRGGKLVIEL